jgi:WD40 repeat protein
MTSRARSGVFLSYARKDGEPFAAMLRDRLREKAPDIVVKQDRILLEGGVGWWKQLAEAIDSVEFLVLVMTPSSMQSEMVRREWRYARQQGVCVYPVKGAPDSELRFTDLPRWMSKAHFFDIDREWESLVSHLRKGCDTARVPFMAPDLPENFVNRPEEFGRLKNLLLSPDRKDPVAITTSLSGAGGFGKTTLAAALCHDEDIVQNFDDGILWVTLGQNANVMNGLVTAYAALTGDRPGFANEEDAAFQLGQTLEELTCLLVIDDVWDEAHLRPFLRGGRGSARLFTTRMAAIATGARSVSVEEMREGESLQLMTRGVPGLDERRARLVSERLGDWPLALELAVAMMREGIAQGDSVEHSAQWLIQILDRQGPRGLEGTAGLPQHRSIDSVLAGSLKLLNSADRNRLKDLSIFPANIPIPLTAATSLWRASEFESTKTAQLLARLSLVKFDRGRGFVLLHDVIRNWLAVETDNAVELHSRLVDAWPEWGRLPDKYAWRWLPWHLAQAGRRPEIERLLWDPQWLRAKLRATDVNALIEDFDHLKPAREAELIQDALRLSSHILAKDPSQFNSQLAGRLLLYEREPVLQRFSVALAETADSPWLRPLVPVLESPGTGLVRTLAGHTSSVQCVAVTADGRWAVSGSYDRTLKFWDLETGDEVRSLRGHSDTVNAVAVTPDGRHVITGSADSTLRVWDLETGSEMRSFTGHSSAINAVAVTSDGRRVVSACKDRTLKVWDLEAGVEVRTFAGHYREVTAVAVTPDGRRAVSASPDKMIMVWDLESGAELRTLAGHTSSVQCVAVTGDGRRVVSRSYDNTLKVCDLESGAELHTLVGHTASVECVAITADGRRAVSGSHDKTLKVWDLETGAEVRTLAGHSDTVKAVAVTPDGRRAISGSSDSTLRIWDLEIGFEARTRPGHDGAVTGVAVTPGGRLVVSSSKDRSLKVWDLKTGAELRTIEGHSHEVNGVAITPDGHRAVSASSDETLKVWDLETGAELRELVGHSDRVRAVAVTPSGQFAVSVSDDKMLRVWSLETGDEVRTIRGQSKWIYCVAVTPDGRRAVSGSWNLVKGWDLKSGEDTRTLAGHTSQILAVAITPDGHHAVSGSRDETIKVWDLVNGGDPRTLARHSNSVNGVAVTPDGQWVFSASNDHTLKIWNIQTGEPVATFVCESFALCCACADSRTFLAGDQGGRLYILALETPQEDEVQLNQS